MTAALKIIYNVTTKVSHAIHHSWLQWMQQEHIPKVIATGCFAKAQILKLKEQQDEEGATYAVQYYAESEAKYNLYIQQYAAKLRQDGFTKWGDQFISFRTVMEVVN